MTNVTALLASSTASIYLASELGARWTRGLVRARFVMNKVTDMVLCRYVAQLFYSSGSSLSTILIWERNYRNHGVHSMQPDLLRRKPVTSSQQAAQFSKLPDARETGERRRQEKVLSSTKRLLPTKKILDEPVLFRSRIQDTAYRTKVQGKVFHLYNLCQLHA